MTDEGTIVAAEAIPCKPAGLAAVPPVAALDPCAAEGAVKATTSTAAARSSRNPILRSKSTIFHTISLCPNLLAEKQGAGRSRLMPLTNGQNPVDYSGLHVGCSPTLLPRQLCAQVAALPCRALLRDRSMRAPDQRIAIGLQTRIARSSRKA